MPPANPITDSILPSATTPTNDLIPSDCFSANESSSAPHPQPWSPPQHYSHYSHVPIASLTAGPRPVAFTGRIANVFSFRTASAKPRAARGCWRIVVHDAGGAVTVRLWFAAVHYGVCLGRVVSVWATHVSCASGGLAVRRARTFVSVFPERDRGCFVKIYDESEMLGLYRLPMGYQEGQQLGGLMTLKSFADGGYEVSDAKILGVVKSIGAKKKVTNKKGGQSECINITIFDDTSDVSLTLWDTTIASTTNWKPFETVLLLSNPGWRIGNRIWISLTSNTFVDVDPSIGDADWLRRYAQRLNHRECVQPEWPEKATELADVASTSPSRILFTFANLDEFARSDPKGVFSGYLSVLITELNVALLHRRQMLCCNECCGVAIFANGTSSTCQQCQKPVTLRLNPKVLGPVVDETGTASTGALIFSHEAWQQLLGARADRLCAMDYEGLKHLESRLLWLRVTLCFVWFAEQGEAEMGRLWIWDVKP